MNLKIKNVINEITKYKHIIFDFDGVLADTNPIRINGFRKLFSQYPGEQVEKIIAYATANGGLSRFKKIEYFFNFMRNEPISDQEVDDWARKYSDVVKQDIIDAAEIEGSVEFLKRYNEQHDFAIVSGSEQNELRDVCIQRKIGNYFDLILGSPVSKEENILKMLSEMSWKKEDCVFIGDAINDINAAKETGLYFVGRNSGLTDWNEYEGVISFDKFSEDNYYENN